MNSTVQKASSLQPMTQEEPKLIERTKSQGEAPIKNLLFQNKYMTTAKVSSTQNIDIYVGLSLEDNQQILLKTEKTNSRVQTLGNEARTLSNIKGKGNEETIGVPKFIWYGTEEDLNVLALELTGPNLGNLLKTCNQKFSLRTVLMLADQMIRRLEFIHLKGFLHRNIKPQNFAIGVLEKSNTVYLINYGISRQYKNSKTGQHKAYAENRDMVGSVTFSSINCHLGIEPSRRDDLESLGYTLVYMLKGSLPWERVEGNSTREKVSKVMERKLAMPIEFLCKGLPDEFCAFLNYTKGLKYDEKPDYRYLRELFRRVMAEKGFAYDGYFDWITSAEPRGTYEFGNMSISFKSRLSQQADITMVSQLQTLLRSHSKPISEATYDVVHTETANVERDAASTEPNAVNIEHDAFSQQEQESSSIVPSDLPISDAYNHLAFPLKMMPPSATRSINPCLVPSQEHSDVSPIEDAEKVEVKHFQRSLTLFDGDDKERDNSRFEFAVSRRAIRTVGSKPSVDPQDYLTSKTGSMVTKTVSFKIPSSHDNKDRKTVFNVYITNERSGEDFESEENDLEADIVTERHHKYNRPLSMKDKVEKPNSKTSIEDDQNNRDALGNSVVDLEELDKASEVKVENGDQNKVENGDQNKCNMF